MTCDCHQGMLAGLRLREFCYAGVAQVVEPKLKIRPVQSTAPRRSPRRNRASGVDPGLVGILTFNACGFAGRKDEVLRVHLNQAARPLRESVECWLIQGYESARTG